MNERNNCLVTRTRTNILAERENKSQTLIKLQTKIENEILRKVIIGEDLEVVVA